MSGRRLAPLALLVASATACGGAEEARRERESVIAKIDALRNADRADPKTRRAALEALENVASKTPAVIEARDACVMAYRSLLEGRAQADEAEAAMKSGERVDPIDMARKLEASSKLLERSTADMPRCDKAASDLRVAR